MSFPKKQLNGALLSYLLSPFRKLKRKKENKTYIKTLKVSDPPLPLLFTITRNRTKDNDCFWWQNWFITTEGTESIQALVQILYNTAVLVCNKNFFLIKKVHSKIEASAGLSLICKIYSLFINNS